MMTLNVKFTEPTALPSSTLDALSQSIAVPAANVLSDPMPVRSTAVRHLTARSLPGDVTARASLGLCLPANSVQ